MRADRYAVTPQLPMFPGVEVAGVVEAVGQGVDAALLGGVSRHRCLPRSVLMAGMPSRW